jgi:hypothetical protein
MVVRPVDSVIDLEGLTDRMAWLMAQQSTLPSYMPPSIPDKDVTVELPVTQALYEAGRGDLTGCQTFQWVWLRD